jgi:hypothetical protein
MAAICAVPLALPLFPPSHCQSTTPLVAFATCIVGPDPPRRASPPLGAFTSIIGLWDTVTPDVQGEHLLSPLQQPACAGTQSSRRARRASRCVSEAGKECQHTGWAGQSCREKAEAGLVPGTSRTLQSLGGAGPSLLKRCLFFQGWSSGCTGCAHEGARALVTRGPECCLASGCMT